MRRLDDDYATFCLLGLLRRCRGGREHAIRNELHLGKAFYEASLLGVLDAFRSALPHGVDSRLGVQTQSMDKDTGDEDARSTISGMAVDRYLCSAASRASTANTADRDTKHGYRCWKDRRGDKMSRSHWGYQEG